VGHTFFFLTATFIAGQDAAGTDIITVPQSPRVATLGEPIPAEHNPNLWERMRSWKPFARNDEGSSGDRPRLFQRMQNRLNGLFQRSSGSDSGGSVPAASPAPSVPGSKRSEPPVAGSKAPNLFVAPANFHAANLAPPHASLTLAMAEKSGHDANFSWITGQLRNENGKWIVYYSTPEVVDRFSGHLTLNVASNQISNFRDGDLVSLEGHLAKGAYDVATVHLIEHETK
jgi:hypothetical protein